LGSPHKREEEERSVLVLTQSWRIFTWGERTKEKGRFGRKREGGKKKKKETFGTD